MQRFCCVIGFMDPIRNVLFFGWTTYLILIWKRVFEKNKEQGERNSFFEKSMVFS